jgi:hypothetical protein
MLKISHREFAPIGGGMIAVGIEDQNPWSPETNNHWRL